MCPYSENDVTIFATVICEMSSIEVEARWLRTWTTRVKMAAQTGECCKKFQGKVALITGQLRKTA